MTRYYMLHYANSQLTYTMLHFGWKDKTWVHLALHKMIPILNLRCNLRACLLLATWWELKKYVLLIFPTSHPLLLILAHVNGTSYLGELFMFCSFWEMVGMTDTCALMTFLLQIQDFTYMLTSPIHANLTISFFMNTSSHPLKEVIWQNVKHFPQNA